MRLRLALYSTLLGVINNRHLGHRGSKLCVNSRVTVAFTGASISQSIVMLHRLYSLAGSMSLVLLCSCMDWSEYKVDEVDLNPSLALPLIKGGFSIADMLENADPSVIKIDPDGLISFTYTADMETGSISEEFSLPDKSTAISFVLPGAVFPSIPQDLKTDSINRTLAFDMAPERIDEVGLLSGELAVSTSIVPASSDLQYEVRIFLPGFISPAQLPLNAIVGGTTSIGLDGYKLLLGDNTFPLKIVLILKKRSTPVVIAPGTSINVQLAFRNFQFRYMKGFLGQQTFDLPETGVEMGDFGDLFGGAVVSLAQPKVSMTITNEYGVPCVGEFVVLEARKEGANPLPILLNPASPVVLNSPAIMGDQAVTTVAITNVNEILNYAPTAIQFQASAAINKGLTDGENFVVDTSTMRIKLDVEVPLYGSASGIVLRDTVAIDLSQTEGSEVVSASLKLKITNDLPLDGTVQLALLDAHDKFIDVLLDDDQMNILRGSKVLASGDLLTPGVFDGMIELSNDKIEKVFTARKIAITIGLQTTRNNSGGAQNVKFKSHYAVQIEAGLLADLKLKIN
jgi:hypothetical protein